MFKNIGKKIKSVAALAAGIIILLSVITAIVLFANATQYNDFFEIKTTNKTFIEMGIVCLLVGPILGFFDGWLIYGFGELIDKVCDIERAINKPDNNGQTSYDRIVFAQQTAADQNSPIAEHIDYQQWKTMNRGKQ